MQSNSHEPITTTIGDFSRLTGLGRSTIYELLGERKLDSVKIGKRRLILLDSYRRLLERQLPPVAAPTGPGRPAASNRKRGRPRVQRVNPGTVAKSRSDR